MIARKRKIFINFPLHNYDDGLWHFRVLLSRTTFFLIQHLIFLQGSSAVSAVQSFQGQVWMSLTDQNVGNFMPIISSWCESWNRRKIVVSDDQFDVWESFVVCSYSEAARQYMITIAEYQNLSFDAQTVCLYILNW